MFGGLFLTQQHPWNSFPVLERPFWHNGCRRSSCGSLGCAALLSFCTSPPWLEHGSTVALHSARHQGGDTREMCWEIKWWECPDTQRLSEAFLIEKITCLYSKQTFEAGKKNLSAIAFCFFHFPRLDNKYMCVCVYLCTYVYMCVFMCTYMYIHVCMCVCTNICVFICINP